MAFTKLILSNIAKTLRATNISVLFTYLQCFVEYYDKISMYACSSQRVSQKRPALNEDHKSCKYDEFGSCLEYSLFSF